MFKIQGFYVNLQVIFYWCKPVISQRLKTWIQILLGRRRILVKDVKMFPTWWEIPGWEEFNYSYVFSLNAGSWREFSKATLFGSNITLISDFFLTHIILQAKLEALLGPRGDRWIITEKCKFPEYHFVIAVKHDTDMMQFRLAMPESLQKRWNDYFGATNNRLYSK